MKGLTPVQIEAMFTIQPAFGDAKLALLKPIFEQGKKMAMLIYENCPANADTTTAIRKLRECVMTATASVCLHGRI